MLRHPLYNQQQRGFVGLERDWKKRVHDPILFVHFTFNSNHFLKSTQQKRLGTRTWDFSHSERIYFILTALRHNTLSGEEIWVQKVGGSLSHCSQKAKILFCLLCFLYCKQQKHSHLHMLGVLNHCKSVQTEENFICSLSTANVNGRALVINVMVCSNYLLQLGSFRVDVLSIEVMLWYILIKSVQCYLLFLEGSKCNVQNSGLSGRKRTLPRAKKYLYLFEIDIIYY